MVYDADGERLIRRDPDGTATRYLGSMAISVSGTTVTGKRYYAAPDGETVAIRTAGADLTWLLSGLHSSTQLSIPTPRDVIHTINGKGLDALDRKWGGGHSRLITQDSPEHEFDRAGRSSLERTPRVVAK